MLGITADRKIEPSHLIVAVISLSSMTALNVWTGGYLKMFCVLVGIVMGYVASIPLGQLNLSSVIPAGGLTLLNLPRVDHISFKFDAHLLLPFAVAAFASALRVMGDATNCQRLNDKDWVRPNFRSLAAAVTANGLGTVVCGLVGTIGPNSYSSSVGLAAATGVASRVIGYAVGLIFVVMPSCLPRQCCSWPCHRRSWVLRFSLLLPSCSPAACR